MIGSMGLNVEAYPSAEAFLDSYQESPDSPKCMVLDVRMPGLSGLGLQQMLAAEGRGMPIIMISGCADIPMAVKAMRAGAMDFLEKPISSQTLSTRIREAIDHHVRQQRQTSRKTELVRQVDKLSARQREVLDLLVAGERSKQIARQLGIGEKTVAKHRATRAGKDAGRQRRRVGSPVRRRQPGARDPTGVGRPVQLRRSAKPQLPGPLSGHRPKDGRAERRFRDSGYRGPCSSACIAARNRWNSRNSRYSSGASGSDSGTGSGLGAATGFGAGSAAANAGCGAVCHHQLMPNSRAFSTEQINSRSWMLNSSTSQSLMRMSPAITRPVFNTRSRMSARLSPCVALVIELCLGHKARIPSRPTAVFPTGRDRG